MATADPCLYPLALGQLELAVMSCSLAARHPLARAALCRWLAAAEAPVAAMCRFWEAQVAHRLVDLYKFPLAPRHLVQAARSMCLLPMRRLVAAVLPSALDMLALGPPARLQSIPALLLPVLLAA